jgi:Holliday junction resolvase RusA-like endonuclease
MLESFRCHISGVPYCHNKSRGVAHATTKWTQAVREQTRTLPKVLGPCLLRVTFRLPPDKFPSDHPYGSDLDNLLKRFFDALNATIFSDVPGKDGCVVSLEVTKTRVAGYAESGADLEVILLPTPSKHLEHARGCASPAATG